MLRDLSKYAVSLELHHAWQWDYFILLQSKKYERAAEWREKGERDKAEAIDLEADNMRFQFNRRTAMVNFGDCHRFNKPVSFIPDTLQLYTQKCFIHRKH